MAAALARAARRWDMGDAMTTTLIVAGIAAGLVLLLVLASMFGANKILTDPQSLSGEDLEREIRLNRRLMELSDAMSPEWSDSQRKVSAALAEQERRKSDPDRRAPAVPATGGWGRNMLINACVGFGMLALFVGGIVGWDYWDASAYTPVEARIDAIRQVCRIRWDCQGCTARISADMSCADARRRQPDEGGVVVEYRDLAYTYVSPADGRAYPGSIRVEAPVHADARPGDRIRILAHKSDPGRSRDQFMLDRPESEAPPPR